MNEAGAAFASQHSGSQASAERRPLGHTGCRPRQRRRLACRLCTVRCRQAACLCSYLLTCVRKGNEGVHLCRRVLNQHLRAGDRSANALCTLPGRTHDYRRSDGRQPPSRLPAGDNSTPPATRKQAAASRWQQRQQRRRTFCGGGRLRSPEQEQWLHRACQWPDAPAERAAERSGRAGGAPKDPTTPFRPCKPAGPVHVVLRLTDS